MKTMIRMTALGAIALFFAGCGSSRSTPTDAAVIDQGTFDVGAGAEASKVDTSAGSDALVNSDVSTKADAAIKPSALQAKIVKASAWANLMPIVRPDPTLAKVEVELKNTSKIDVTGVKLQNAALQLIANPATTHPLKLVTSMSSFTGAIKAGQTRTVAFSHQASKQRVAVPFKCDSKIKLILEVAYDGGSVGPLERSPLTFICAY